MKVKEIIEVLNIPLEELLTKLENVSIKADLETDIDPKIIKKLSKVYGVEIKPIKAKKVKVETVEENPAVEIVETVVEVKKEEAIKEVKKPEVKTEIKKEEPKKEISKVAPSKKKKMDIKKTGEVEEEKLIKTETKTAGDVELSRVYDDTYVDYEQDVKQYTRIKNIKKTKSKSTSDRQANVPQEKDSKVLYFTNGMTVARIADGLSVSVGEVVKRLIMLGYMANANQVIDRDIVELIAIDFGFDLKNEIETDITKFEKMDIVDEDAALVERPAIVTIMGHVDHGKTTLLDRIRNTKVTASEAGGITQHIGAYQINENGKFITFIDTPGHAAFTEMRARGAEVTDIVVIVVAADDGVMPQTREAIEHAQAAKVPIIVAVNKMDKPSANPERVKQELANLNLVSEDWGGSTIFVELSALTGVGVDNLLGMIILVSEMEQFKANPNRLGIGTVLEARLDRGRGVVATLLVKNGSIKIGDPIVVGNTHGKIRAMTDETLADIKTALPSKAVEVTGLEEVPNAGDRFMVFEDEKTARLVAEERLIRAFNELKGVGKAISLANLFDGLDDSDKELSVIVKADMHGSIEAIKTSLEKVEVAGAKITIVRSAVGSVTETDISLAIASNSIIIGFNVRPMSKIMDLAKEKGIEIRLYNVIYKLLEDIEAAMKGMLDPVFEEKVTGQVEVREIFKASKIGTIAGCYVTSGLVGRNSEIRLIRDGIVVYEGKLSSLKRHKDDIKEVKLGYECGMTIENFNDIKVGDIIEAFIMAKVK